jgi:tyrosine-protein phosphatase YwqE
MFFWKKKKEPVDLSWLGVDMHSHLIPGIDDGSPDMASSIALIREMQQLGYRKIITTPHILSGLYPNTTEIILSGLDDLRKELAAQQMDIEVYAAAEYFIDEHFQEQLKAKAPLLTLKDNLVLVEFSMITAPLDLQDVLFEMQLQHYQPIIAHPERYVYLRSRMEFFEELKNAGAQFQLNLLSITGHYGAHVRELAEYLLQKGMYDYAATDLHGPRHIEKLKTLTSAPLYTTLKEANLKNALLM